MAGAGGHMMASVLTEGALDSAYGVSLAGFWAPVREFHARLENLPAWAPAHLAVCESDGYIMLLACRSPWDRPGKSRIAMFRREPHKFFPDLALFLKSLRATMIEQILLSSSLGSIQMTVLYREAPEAPGA